MTKFPLAWPAGWKRTTQRHTARFSRKNWSSGWREKITIAAATDRVMNALRMMGIDGLNSNIIISSNLVLKNDGLPRSGQGEPKDPGIAVYWRRKSGEQYRVMAIDQYDKVADNLAAIAATLEAMRAIERHGGAVILERAFTGFTALPAPNTWRAVLGFDEQDDVTLDDARAMYRNLAMQTHPDKVGGSESAMKELNWAMAEAEKELGA